MWPKGRLTPGLRFVERRFSAMEAGRSQIAQDQGEVGGTECRQVTVFAVTISRERRGRGPIWLEDGQEETMRWV